MTFIFIYFFFYFYSFTYKLHHTLFCMVSLKSLKSFIQHLRSDKDGHNRRYKTLNQINYSQSHQRNVKKKNTVDHNWFIVKLTIQLKEKNILTSCKTLTETFFV